MKIFFTIFSGFVIAQSAIYYLYGITWWTVVGSMAAVVVMVSLTNHDKLPRPFIPSLQGREIGRVLPIVLADLGLLATFIAGRTGEPVDTPWIFGPAVFALYAVATGWYLFIAPKVTTTTARAVLTLHFFTAFSLVAIVVKHGFGFDPFIHEAAAKHIDEHGVLLPKTPYYIGQYALVVALHKLTRLPIMEINRWLVPILASVTLPTLAIRAFGPRRALGLLLLPLAPLTFTTPYNLTFLILLWVLLLRPDWKIGALLGLAATAIHPLLGVPILIIAVSRGWWTFALSATALPILFVANNLLRSAPPLVTTNPLTRLDYFWGLFREPITFATQGVPWPWELLYIAARLLPWVVVLIGVVVSIRQKTYHLLAAAAGLFVAIFLLATTIEVPGIIWYEQSEFVLRLMYVLPVLLLPIVLTIPPLNLPPALQGGETKKSFLPLAQQGGGVRWGILSLLFSVVLTSSWYLTYPQINPKSIVAGWNASDADVAAIRLLEKNAGNRPYIVLSNQMMSAAALREFGFEKTLTTYALPTSGEHYARFLEMTQTPHRDIVLTEMRRANVTRGFFVLHDYWPFSEELLTALQSTTTTWYPVYNNRIVIFDYEIP